MGRGDVSDEEGRIDWSMAGVDPASCRAHQHSAGARGHNPRSRPDHLGGDKAYSSRRNRRYLRRPADQASTPV